MSRKRSVVIFDSHQNIIGRVEPADASRMVDCGGAVKISNAAICLCEGASRLGPRAIKGNRPSGYGAYFRGRLYRGGRFAFDLPTSDSMTQSKTKRFVDEAGNAIGVRRWKNEKPNPKVKGSEDRDIVNNGDAIGRRALTAFPRDERSSAGKGGNGNEKEDIVVRLKYEIICAKDSLEAQQ